MKDKWRMNGLVFPCETWEQSDDSSGCQSRVNIDLLTGWIVLSRDLVCENSVNLWCWHHLGGLALFIYIHWKLIDPHKASLDIYILTSKGFWLDHVIFSQLVWDPENGTDKTKYNLFTTSCPLNVHESVLSRHFAFSHPWRASQHQRGSAAVLRVVELQTKVREDITIRRPHTRAPTVC